MRVAAGGPGEPDARRAELAEIVGRLADDEQADGRERRRLLGRLTALLAGRVRGSGVRAALTGSWLPDAVAEVAEHLPVRDLGTLRTHHGGLTGDALAEQLVQSAARVTGAIGAAGGAVAAVEMAAPPALLATPVQVAAETLAVVAVELKLVAELHVVYGRAPLASRSQVAGAYLSAWLSKKAVAQDAALPPVAALLGTATRRQLSMRLARRAGRNVTTLAPLLVGAVLGAELNRRETRALGERLVEDLRRPPRRRR